MVKENRIVFSLSDIHKIRICCKNCDGEVVVKLAQRELAPENCPHCNATWPGHKNAQEFQLINTIRNILGNPSPYIGLLLELPDTPSNT